MTTTREAMEALVSELSSVKPLAGSELVLAATARALADEIDSPDEGRSVANAVKELRAVMAELIRGAGRGGKNETGADSWAAIAGVTEIRDAKRSVKADSGTGGRRGRKAAS